jgi:uncharacterized protein
MASKGLIMKRLFSIMVCTLVIFSVQATGAQEKVKWPDKQIEELSTKFFLYSTTGGKQTLVSTTEPEKDGYCQRFGDACDHTIVKLTSPGAALSIPGTSLILAFLEGPAPLGFDHDAIVTIFDRSDLTLPRCYSRLYLIADVNDYYGSIKSLEVRETANKALNVVVTGSGGDGPDLGRSLTFLRVGLNCRIAVLSKLDSSLYCNSGCEGTEVEYHFVDNDNVEVTTRELALADQENTKIVQTKQKKYQFQGLYDNPEWRTFPSNSQKAAAILSSGSDVNTRDGDGTTPLIWAARRDCLEIVNGLSDNGADMDAKDNLGQTALMYAAYWGYFRLAKLLIDKGADVNIKDEHGRTALTWALRNSQPKIAELLKAQGAEE